MPSIISSAAVASLALGIGSVLAMFTLVNSVLRPLVIIAAAATMVMLVAATVAACGPAYRASATDPSIVLRHL